MSITRSALLGALALFAIIPVRAQPEDAPGPHGTCFFSDQFQNWRAADAQTIYIRVRPQRFFRLDLANPCPILTSPGAQLITRFRGKRQVCSPLDWDLSVHQWGGGASAQCAVQAMTPLSPSEVASLPPRLRPQ